MRRFRVDPAQGVDRSRRKPRLFVVEKLTQKIDLGRVDALLGAVVGLDIAQLRAQLGH